MEPAAENSSSEANLLTRLLPIYPTGAAFQGTPGDSNQIKSLSALQASHLYSPCSEEILQGPDSEANGMTKQRLPSPVQAKEWCPQSLDHLWCVCLQGAGVDRVWN